MSVSCSAKLKFHLMFNSQPVQYITFASLYHQMRTLTSTAALADWKSPAKIEFQVSSSKFQVTEAPVQQLATCNLQLATISQEV